MSNVVMIEDAKSSAKWIVQRDTWRIRIRWYPLW